MSMNKNLNPIKIRYATQVDIADIVRLVRELAEHSDEYSPIQEDYARYFLRQPNCYVLLAEAEGRTIGLLSYLLKPDLYHASDTCYITELIVTEDSRKRGAGSALMEYLFKRMIAEGCVEVSVSTMPDNQDAIRFYKKLGLVDEAVLLEKHFQRLPSAHN
jgi:ribosomal protein S18 acetylase RimI-like enzyme